MLKKTNNYRWTFKFRIFDDGALGFDLVGKGFLTIESGTCLLTISTWPDDRVAKACLSACFTIFSLVVKKQMQRFEP